MHRVIFFNKNYAKILVPRVLSDRCRITQEDSSTTEKKYIRGFVHKHSIKFSNLFVSYIWIEKS